MPEESDPQGAGAPLTAEELREREIQAAAVYSIPRHNAPVQLDEYNPTWPRLFEREALRIRGALGERALLIEHAGSTSVPGLAAKPIIDILLVVADSSDEASYVPDLEAAGYVLRIRELQWHQHRLFKGPDTNINLHVHTQGCVEIDRFLRFRDYVRAHPEERLLYEGAKRKLAKQTWMYVQNYADAKTDVVEEILTRAGAPGRPPANCPCESAP
jgi:GrpB-like predicted nucleotidyltransferase (UPF0157 family)